MISVERDELASRQKLDLLEQLFRSQALGRSDQLRQLLRYLVTEEIEGRSALLTEHMVGVEALGRSASYSPETDSTVRTRAHELRRRLDDYYRDSAPGTWRIDLPRGTYQPRFVRINSREEPELQKDRQRQWSSALIFLAGFATAVLVALAVWAAWNPAWLRSAPEAAVDRIWRNALTPNSTVTVAVATPLQFWVRKFDPESLPKFDPPFLVPAPESEQLLSWYSRQRFDADGKFYLHPNHHSPLWGEAAGAVTLTKFLTERWVRVELLAERNIRPITLKEHHAVLIGRPEYNSSAEGLQPRDGYAIRYVTGHNGVAVVDSTGKVRFSRERDGRVNYGLATFLARRSENGILRTVLFSGINSDGTHAAIEYMTSPRRLQELVAAMQEKGGVPESFQVVVRSNSVDTYTLEAERVDIHVLDPWGKPSGSREGLQ